MDSVGLPPDLFTATFAASRSVRWSANVLEQVANNRLIRPEIEYTGPRDRKVTPLEARPEYPHAKSVNLSGTLRLPWNMQVDQ